MEKKILVVVDMQNDFLTGALANESAVKVIPNIIKEIKQGNYTNIIFTRDSHDENYLNSQEGKLLPFKHCIKNTIGWQVCEDLLDATKDLNIPIIFIDKPTFGYKDWEKSIEVDNDTELIFTGTCTDICVVSNVLAVKATFPETKVTCLANCCAPLFGSKVKQDAALEVMKSCQVNVVE